MISKKNKKEGGRKTSSKKSNAGKKPNSLVNAQKLPIQKEVKQKKTPSPSQEVQGQVQGSQIDPEKLTHEEKDFLEPPLTDVESVNQVGDKNLRIQAQTQDLQVEPDKLIKNEEEGQSQSLIDKGYFEQVKAEDFQLREQIQSLKNEAGRLRQFEEDCDRLQKKIQPLQDDILRLKNILELSEKDKNQLEQILENEKKEKQTYIEKSNDLEAKLQSGNTTIEKLLEQKQDLDAKLRDKTYQIAIEWAQGLGEILTKLSALAEKEPEPILGLKPRAVYETLLSWLEKTFGERPKTFPSLKEFTNTKDGKYLITLDADMEGIQALLKRYDWSHEGPFEGKLEGQRQCQFKVMHWGWKVNDTILVRSKVTTYNAEPA